jgi:glutamate-1-semialdehyde 2,1-aminomutase
MSNSPQPLEYNDLDRRIWEEELDSLVPQDIFDVHTHIYRWAHNLDPAKQSGPLYELAGRPFPEATWALLDACDRQLLPDRQVHRLAFPFPFFPACDFQGANRSVAEQSQSDPRSAALMLVHPSMTAEHLDEQVRSLGFVGFKPYRFYSRTGDAVSCRIADFLPEHQIEVADRHGLLIMLHLAKRDGIADPENIEDLTHLTAKYPRAKWILAHCARSYSTWAIEQAAAGLRGLANVWYETSSVCESDAIEALLAGVGVDRVMYGSDDVPVGVARGKYITFGRAWAFLSENNHSLNLSHCDPRMTFVRYEQLRAMRRAALRLNLSRGQIEDLFCNTAARLIDSVRRSCRSGPA